MLDGGWVGHFSDDEYDRRHTNESARARFLEYMIFFVMVYE